jgi:hypothetical protein
VPILEAIKCSSCLSRLFLNPKFCTIKYILMEGSWSNPWILLCPLPALVIHISETSKSIYANQLKDTSVASFMYQIYRCTRGKPKKENVLWLQDTTISVLQQPNGQR